MQSTAFGKTPVTQMLLVMKMTAFLLIACFLQVAARTHAQVTLKEKSTSLEKVLAKIKQQSDYGITYDLTLIRAKAKPVVVDITNVSVERALEEVFKNQDQLTYSLNGKVISVKERSEKKLEPITGGLNPRLEIAPPATKDISGKITDADGNPLGGASVKVKGSGLGTSANVEGIFILKGVDENATIEISFVGYETMSLKVGTRTSFVVSLKAKEESLQEVVVNKGYYTEKHRLSTGNVSTVTSKEIEKQPVSNVLLAMQGRVPGMEITQANGLPGSGITVRIRGQNSISNGNLPLYVIDGVPYTSELLSGLGSILNSSGGGDGTRYGNPLNYINPADIESIDILKDADATAIYGSRGANGVVLITTRKGKAGQTTVNVNMQQGWSKVSKKMSLLNTQQYLDMRREAILNDGLTIQPTDYDLTEWDTTRHTDWQKELIGRTAQYTDMQASVSGGNSTTQYFISTGYHKENTVFPGEFNDQRGALHFSINTKSPNGKFKLLLSGNYTIDDNRLPRYDLTSYALTLSPFAPQLYNSDGSLNWAPISSGVGTWENPLAYTVTKFSNRTNNLVGNAMISYQLSKHFEIKSNFGYTNLQTDEKIISPSLYYDPSRWASLGQSLRTANFVNNNIRSWIVEPQIAYDAQIGKGQLTALIGTTFQQQISNGQNLRATGFNSDLIIDDIKSAPTVTVAGNINAVYKYNALFGRINYNLQNKYLINLTARRDGTSRFGPERQFHNFGALGVGWVFSKENFIKQVLPFLSFGKLRFSYGTTGSDQVGDYSFMDLYRPITAGVPYQGFVGLQSNALYNLELAWEETRKAEAAIEIGFLEDRILFTVSVYRNRSSNQLTNYSLPSVTGFSSIKRNLNALVQNSGWEFALNTKNLSSKNFQWKSSFNLTLSQNKLVSVDPGMGASYLRLVGYSLGTQFLYHNVGVDAGTGLYMFDDGHGKSTLRPDTSILLSQHATNLFPKFYAGLQNSISFKGFELDFIFQYSSQIGNNYRLGSALPGYIGYNQPVSVLNRWRKIGDDATIQKYNSDFNSFQSFDYAKQSDISYSTASFLRLKNLQLSWQLPLKCKQKCAVQSCRLYVQGQNLFTITNYEGLDPETKSVISLPPLRVLTFGVQLTL